MNNNELQLETFSKAYKVLSNPARLCILMQLLKKEKVNVSNLVCCSKKSQSYVSQELAKLKKWKIVSCEKVGAENFYSLTDQNILEILKNTFNCVTKGD